MLSRRHSIAWLYPSSVARETDHILRQAFLEARLTIGSADVAQLVEGPWPVGPRYRRALIRSATGACAIVDNGYTSRSPKATQQGTI